MLNRNVNATLGTCCRKKEKGFKFKFWVIFISALVINLKLQGVHLKIYILAINENRMIYSAYANTNIVH